MITCLLTLLINDLLIDLLEDVLAYQSLSVEGQRARLGELDLADNRCSFWGLLILLGHCPLLRSIPLRNLHGMLLPKRTCTISLLSLEADVVASFLMSRLQR